MNKTLFKLFLLSGLTFALVSEIYSQPQKGWRTETLDSLTVYNSQDLLIKKLSPNVYVHISFLATNDFGKVECNGMVVINQGEAIVFDTPTETTGSGELIKFVKEKLKSKVVAVVPTHFHNDCVGGLAVFEKDKIPLYVNSLTMNLLKKDKVELASSIINVFDDHFSLSLGDEEVFVEYFGAGHTSDNVIAYFPAANTIFGGCLVKEVGASKGFLGDANVTEWAATVAKIKSKYPEVSLVIPGHGKWGGVELLDYTIELFILKK
ncbi:subclass B1 metallo-beta-lactamase [Marivirga lumbricoides]|uniref:beta-lactamase n=1 Tax=Marivirga lumbricoides TaxID=1046115 RepID=A0A2T4DUH0_9BACT|nr:subclass B1 metallo-beta-lactamase [Marivirga lumbricoides]